MLLVVSLLLLCLVKCSVDYSLLNNRQCDNEGRCIAGYICDKTTMTCVKEGTIRDIGILPDVSSDIGVTLDIELNDLGDNEDVVCIPTNNGTEICDGIDNNCNGKTDEDYVCGSCKLATSITEECNETTKCNVCYVIEGEKYFCMSDNGSSFEWRKESEIACNIHRKDKIIRCENLCLLCDGDSYGEPFTLKTESCDGKDNDCNGLIDDGNICSTYEVCVNGKCVEKSCSKNEECPAGKVCKNSKCVSCQDTVDDSLCGSGKICVNGACIEGNCHKNSDCSIGICISNKCCQDCCVDKKDCPKELVCKQQRCTQCIEILDDWRCGSGYICENSVCVEGECHPGGWSICSATGKLCVNYHCCEPGPTCCIENKHCKENMRCTPNSNCECIEGFGDCNNSFNDGCEKNLQEDPKNCGVCGQICSLPNATAKCSSGRCAIKACNQGYKDCNSKPEDGCEVDTTSDKLNCGDCNVVCEADNADVKCEQSKCVISACKLGFANCDGKYETGCETNIRTSNEHCGDCNNKCPELTSCINGKCQ
ncbi:MAG: MopE-related protein [Deltaproteobacteria bacterium]|nr:MopE-related protein [Deltaproteobacteria bacterium]